MSNLTINLTSGAANGGTVPIRIIPAGGGAPKTELIQMNGSINVTDLPMGDYLVRAQIPNGGLVSQSVRIAQGKSAKVDLDAGVFSPNETAAWAYVAQAAKRRGINFATNADAFSTTEAPSLPVWKGWRSVEFDERLNLAERSDSLFVVSWNSASNDSDAVLDFHVSAPRRRQVVLEVSDGDPPYSTYFFLPPNTHRALLVADPSAKQSPGQFDSPWNLVAEFAVPDAMTLFSYLTRGDWEEAKLVGTHFMQSAVRFLESKMTDYTSALIGAYFLVKATPADATEAGGISADDLKLWLSNLDNLFPGVPDGAVVHGYRHMKLGNFELAAERFKAAVARGLPSFRFGLRMLLDGLQITQARFPNDAALEEAATTVRLWGANVDWDRPLSALRGTTISSTDASHPFTIQLITERIEAAMYAPK
jgi:hypothetical protein